MLAMNHLNKLFNTTPIETLPSTEVLPALPVHTDNVSANVDYDYERTRSNLHSLLDQGQEALLHALEVAKQSEHPRAFEVVGNMMKQLADVNHQLLDLTEKRNKLRTKDPGSQSPGTVNNNAIFVGSTAELNKMLQTLNKG